VRLAVVGLLVAAAAPACGGDRSLGSPAGAEPGATLAASTTLSCARFGEDACCWGDDGQGHELAVPTRVPLPGPPSDIAVLGTLAESGHTACAVVAGDVFCWSFQAAGPPSVEQLPGMGRTVRITANDQHACALDEDGGVRCWGADYFGQLGDGRLEQGPLPPAAVAGLPAAVEIAAGEWHTCARTAKGEVWCWGMGYGPSDGCPGYACSATPVWVPLLAPAVRVSAGGLTTCAETMDGTVWCWDVENGVITAPAAVPSLAGAEPVQPGYQLGCAIPGDHRPICWGSLGHDSTLLTVDHGPVPGLAGVVEYASGWYHACVRTEAGDVVCFGANDVHELGDGTTVDAAVPHATAGCAAL
jgi:alpha-tubulin suppressor-like RCC1 family protein